MDMNTLLSFNWSAMLPEFIVLGTATLLSLLDLFMGAKKDRRLFGWIGLAGISAALLSLLSMFGPNEVIILYDTFVLDPFAKVFKTIFLLGSAIVFLLAISYDPEDRLERGEFYYLLLTALLGAMIMSSSRDLITLFVGLELLSLSSYILAGIRKKQLKSNEAALKYLINGGISTALTLFGMSYLYGITGTTNLIEMQPQLIQIADPSIYYVLGISFLMIFVGLSFKIATVPFHMWAPDVYEGSPTPVTAFLSVVSKAAGFVLILRLFLWVFATIPANSISESMLVSMQAFVAIVAAVTMIVGNTVALRQKNVKRMLAYSSIAHAGYLLVALSSFSNLFYLDTIWFYLVTYLFMNLGAFAVLQLVTKETGSEDLTAFAGLAKRSPFIAISLTVFLLSLAGIPGTAGFIGKLSIFMSSLTSSTPQIVLAAIMIATTVISYIYYFGILTQVYFRSTDEVGKIHLKKPVLIVLILCIAGTILLGLFPTIALDFFYSTF